MAGAAVALLLIVVEAAGAMAGAVLVLSMSTLGAMVGATAVAFIIVVGPMAAVSLTVGSSVRLDFLRSCFFHFIFISLTKAALYEY